jgi:hypothetical protein
MKSLLILITVLLLQTEPTINSFNGVHYNRQNASVVNLGWFTPDNEVSTYTIKRGAEVKFQGVVVQPYRVSIEVERKFQGAQFSIIRTNANGTSQTYYTFVTKNN